MSGVELVAYYAVLSSVALALLTSLVARWLPKAGDAGRVLVTAAAGAATLGLAVRWAGSGHPPIFGTFENTYAATWFVLSVAAAASWAPSGLRDAWRWGPPWAVPLMLWGMRFRAEATPLTISEQSLWVDFHVLFAWLAFVPLLAATTLSGLRLAGRDPLGLDERDSGRLLTRLLLIGFVSMTVMLALGSWYMFLLFGRFWRWEIVETLTLVAWIGYGTAIHARMFGTLRGRGLHALVVSLLPILVLAFFIWSVYAGTYHYFEIPLVKPY